MFTNATVQSVSQQSPGFNFASQISRSMISAHRLSYLSRFWIILVTISVDRKIGVQMASSWCDLEVGIQVVRVGKEN